MKLLHVITSLGTGGAEKLLAESASLYRDQGLSIEVLLLNGNRHPLYNSLTKKNIPVHSLTSGNIKKIYNPLLIFKIIKYLKEFDIIHVHLFPTVYWVALAKKLTRSKAVLIYTEHSTSNKRIKNRLFNRIEKYIYNQYDRVVAITDEIGEIHRSRFPEIPKCKFVTIPNGINISSFGKPEYTETTNPNGNQRTIIQVSSFRYPKDQETLIRALVHLPADVVLKLVGDGENLPKCKELVNKLGLSGRVSFLGIREDIVSLLKSSEIVVLSSHYEGLSLSCIEGMASGRPFIASDVPGLHTIVAGAGLLFPYQDDNALALHIKKLLEDKTFYSEVVERCRERAQNYDIHTMADRYVALYNDLETKARQPRLVRITTVPMSFNLLLKGQMRFMSSYYDVRAVTSPGKEIEEIEKNEGVGITTIPMSRKITPIADFRSFFRVYSYLKRVKPDIVHTHTPKAGTVGMVAAWLARCPNRLHTVAGLPLLEARGYKRKLLDLVEKITYRCATHVYPNSAGLMEIIIRERLTTPDKLKVIANGSSNGINTSHFDPSLFDEESKKRLKSESGIGPVDFTFIFVGRMVGDKGINELVEAFKKIARSHPQAKLLLVGPPEPELDPLKEETSQEIGENKNIIPVGYQSDVRPWFSISDVLVFPSYREGFPNVVMQAGAMGLPSIVSDINGSNEIVIEGKNGTIIPVKNSDAIYKAMERFLTDEDYISRLKENAREAITSRYEQKIVWETLLNEYKSLKIRDLHV